MHFLIDVNTVCGLELTQVYYDEHPNGWDEPTLEKETLLCTFEESDRLQ